MPESESAVAQIARRIACSRLQAKKSPAIFCRTNRYADAARAFWPEGTAREWGLAAGKSERAAGYWLVATSPRDVGPEGQLAIRRELDRERDEINSVAEPSRTAAMRSYSGQQRGMQGGPCR